MNVDIKRFSENKDRVASEKLALLIMQSRNYKEIQDFILSRSKLKNGGIVDYLMDLELKDREELINLIKKGKV